MGKNLYLAEKHVPIHPGCPDPPLLTVQRNRTERYRLKLFSLVNRADIPSEEVAEGVGGSPIMRLEAIVSTASRGDMFDCNVT